MRRVETHRSVSGVAQSVELPTADVSAGPSFSRVKDRRGSVPGGLLSCRRGPGGREDICLSEMWQVGLGPLPGSGCEGIRLLCAHRLLRAQVTHGRPIKRRIPGVGRCAKAPAQNG